MFIPRQEKERNLSWNCLQQFSGIILFHGLAHKNETADLK